eukprot:1923257-Amphidinium_carterae.1
MNRQPRVGYHRLSSGKSIFSGSLQIGLQKTLAHWVCKKGRSLPSPRKRSAVGSTGSELVLHSQIGLQQAGSRRKSLSTCLELRNWDSGWSPPRQLSVDSVEVRVTLTHNDIGAYLPCLQKTRQRSAQDAYPDRNRKRRKCWNHPRPPKVPENNKKKKEETNKI